ncbi:DUF6611 family protein [Conyzicola sp.]|uniref:DUF6611 family protein n=1 Tax=Conyzicola sp. TaxID=1969404 RepID=UPI003989E20B
MTFLPARGTGSPIEPLRALRAMRTRVLEGDQLWGRVDVASSARSLCARYRVVVYPPGTNSAERRQLTFYRNWPVAGALIAMAAMVAAGVLVSSTSAVAVAICVYLAGFVVGGSRSRLLRERCRTVEAGFLFQPDATLSAGRPDLLAATMRQFHALDLARHAGAVDAAQYEARWAEIYNTLEQ